MFIMRARPDLLGCTAMFRFALILLLLLLLFKTSFDFPCYGGGGVGGAAAAAAAACCSVCQVKFRLIT